MRITVLGKSPSWPDAGGACSGYLVDDGQTTLLVDCGSGVFAKLRSACDYAAVDAIVVSHMHADHVADLIPYACALTYGPRRQPPRPRLLLPPGGAAALRTLAAGGGHGADLAEDAFDVGEYEAAGRARVGTLSVAFQPVPHFIATSAIQVRDEATAGSFTFGADHRDTDALDDFAAGTDVLMLEATLPRRDAHASRGHLTAAEAGAIAQRCDARRLVLVHISDELDGERALAAARDAYAGPVGIAREGDVYDV